MKVVDQVGFLGSVGFKFCANTVILSKSWHLLHKNEGQKTIWISGGERTEA